MDGYLFSLCHILCVFSFRSSNRWGNFTYIRNNSGEIGSELKSLSENHQSTLHFYFLRIFSSGFLSSTIPLTLVLLFLSLFSLLTSTLTTNSQSLISFPFLICLSFAVPSLYPLFLPHFSHSLSQLSYSPYPFPSCLPSLSSLSPFLTPQSNIIYSCLLSIAYSSFCQRWSVSLQVVNTARIESSSNVSAICISAHRYPQSTSQPSAGSSCWILHCFSRLCSM